MHRSGLTLFLVAIISSPSLADSCSIAIRKNFAGTADCGQDKCPTFCEQAEPLSLPQCFLIQDLDCKQSNDLSLFLMRPSSAEGQLILSRSELFRYYRQKKPDLYQYYTLKNLEWAGYREQPEPPYAEGSRLQKVANFQLAWQVLLDRRLNRLRSSSLKKQYRAAASWETAVRQQFMTDLQSALSNFGLLTKEEEQSFRLAIDTQMNQGMSLWTKTSALGAKAFLGPKLKTLDTALNEADSLLNQLQTPEQKATAEPLRSLLDSIKQERQSFPCALSSLATCLDEPTALSWDARTDLFQPALDIVTRHLKTLQKLQTELPEPNSTRPQDEQIQIAGQQFLKDPGAENLDLLLAGLWAEVSGVEQAEDQWQKLRSDPSVSSALALRGLDLASDSLGPLSCDTVKNTADEIHRLRQDLKQKYAELENLVRSNEGVGSSEIFRQIEQLLSSIQSLTKRKTQLSAGLNLRTDRVQRYLWDLSKVVPLYQPGSSVQIEWLQLDPKEIPWRSQLSVGWSNFAAEILSLKTDSETFDSYGSALLGDRSTLELSVRQNALIGCGEQQSPRLLVRVRDASGKNRKIILTSMQ